jgi:hypothetical protein
MGDDKTVFGSNNTVCFNMQDIIKYEVGIPPIPGKGRRDDPPVVAYNSICFRWRYIYARTGECRTRRYISPHPSPLPLGARVFIIERGVNLDFYTLL